MISLSGVNKRLGSFRLKDILIEIPDGYICALVGQNASGKTTLIKMILGLCRPDEGTVVIDGLNYQEAECEKRIRDITGIVPVNELMNSELSPLENGRCYGRFCRLESIHRSCYGRVCWLVCRRSCVSV